MIRAAGAAGIGEDEDRLEAIHEGLGFGKIGAGPSPFELLTAIASDHDPPGPTRNLCHPCGTEMCQ